MSARSDALPICLLARLLASASNGMTTRAAAATAMPRTEPAGFNPATRPAPDETMTYMHRTTRRMPETRVVERSMDSIRSGDCPRASNVSRRKRTTPLRSSITESNPKAVSRTLLAMMPAPMASTASAVIHATVNASRRTPRRIAAPLTAVVATLARATGHQKQRAPGAVRESLADIAEYPVVHPVAVVRADDDEVGAKFLGLVEDERRQLVGAMTADVGRSVHARLDRARGDVLAESKRFRDRLLLDRCRGCDNPLPHVHHQHLRAERLGQPGHHRHQLSGIVWAADRDEDLREH